MIGIQYQQSATRNLARKMRTHPLTFLTMGILLGLLAMPSLQASDAARMGWHSPVHPQFELTAPLSSQLNFRFGFSRFDTSAATDQLQSALADQATPVFSASALVDWQVLPGGLHLTGGALYGDLGWSNLEQTRGVAALGRYRSTRNAALHQDRNYLDKVKPYLGLGWKNQFGPDGSFRLQLDLGLVFQSVPPGNESSLSPDYINSAGADAKLGPTFQNFYYTPMFSAGFRYQF
ncbi:MAG: hypothetical protein J5I81_14910 [Nitrococcus mobilis]|nr:hypothetical protein [Nitrococcus mobilis]